MKTLLIHFIRFGPYHLARLKAAQDALKSFNWKVRGLQICSSDEIYAWDDLTGDLGSIHANGLSKDSIETVFPNRNYESLSKTQLKQGVTQTLDRIKPDAVMIAGWSIGDARACMKWCQQHNTPSIVVSETRAVDGNRKWWKEWFKSRLLRQFDAALVGAKSHVDYLNQLGFDSNRIFRGYNTVDNAYFQQNVDRIRTRSLSSPAAINTPPFFLTSNRFIEIKNLSRTLDAFAQYTNENRPGQFGQPWNLCLLGDGPLRESLLRQVNQLGLRSCKSAPWDDIGDAAAQVPTVYFPGFQQVDQLPEYYARASAFLHPAISEPWGLVINEAMASGLPVIASRNGGAVETLVVDDQNGWQFDPLDQAQMVDMMNQTATLSESDRRRMGEESRKLLEANMPSAAFGDGLVNCLRVAGALT